MTNRDKLPDPLTSADYDRLSDALELEGPTDAAPMYYCGNLAAAVAAIVTEHEADVRERIATEIEAIGDERVEHLSIEAVEAIIRAARIARGADHHCGPPTWIARAKGSESRVAHLEAGIKALADEWAGEIPKRQRIRREGVCDGCAEWRGLVASYPEPDNDPWLCAGCDDEVWRHIIALRALLNCTDKDGA